jgi:CP family cyanate transporter-like MFS transporter
MRDLTRRNATSSVPRTQRNGLLLAGILLIAASLRSPITGVGPLIGTIRGDTGISGSVAGVLTTLPVLAFAAASPVAPSLARRIGIERSLFVALLGLFAGVALRSVPTLSTLFAGTVLLGVSIALANVLLPSLVKRDFPHRVGAITSLYAATMNLLAATSSGIAVPIAAAAPGGWRTAIGCWLVLIVLALVLWSPQLGERTVTTEQRAPMPWRSPLAWAVTLYMGLQSLAFYAMVSWLPTILHSRGTSTGRAGWELFLFQVVALVSNFSTPTLIRRLSDQRLLAAGWSLMAGVAFAGLLLAPVLTLLWVVLGGLASGGALVLALSFFGLRSVGSQQAAALSGMAQSVGYLIAASGPVLFGVLHDASGGWSIPLLLLVVLAGVQLLMGYRAGRLGTVRGADSASS